MKTEVIVLVKRRVPTVLLNQVAEEVDGEIV